MPGVLLKILEDPKDLALIEDLQARIWSGNERDIVPAHLLLAGVRNGGLVIGAFAQLGAGGELITKHQGNNIWGMPELGMPLVGFTFGFPASGKENNCVRHYHYSHMLGVDPDYRDRGIGFLLKRAQWQMVRRQEVELITWTYDPLLSRNAHLNISRLGAVCNQYKRNYYGEMRDDLNVGVVSDRFIVKWWLNSSRVNQRFSNHPRLRLDLAHFLGGEVSILNPTKVFEYPKESDSQGKSFFVIPPEMASLPGEYHSDQPPNLVLVEIPSDFLNLRIAQPELGRKWRKHTRMVFESLFSSGYLITDFIYLPGIQQSEGVSKKSNQEILDSSYGRSFYVLSHAETTL